MNCPVCHHVLSGEKYCPNCGQAITYEGLPTHLLNQPNSPNQKYTPQGTYTSNYFGVPQEVRKFNWGAFTMNIIWGIGNKTYLPLLCLIPYFNVIWMFVCGFKGNEWAWKSNNYQLEDLETFLTIQSTWNRGGLAQFILMIASFVLSFVFTFLLTGLMVGLLGL